MNDSFRGWRLIGLCVVAGAFAACSNTSLQESWKAPDVGALKFTKVMVIAATPDMSIRRSAEDAMQAQITGVPVVMSYTVARESAMLADRDRMAGLIKDSGADGVIVMRTIADEQEVSYVPNAPMPGPYTSLWGYYTPGFGLSGLSWQVSTPIVDRVVGIETNIYSVADESLVWSGFTRTRNPGNVASLVAEVAQVVRDKLREQQLIP